MQNIADDLFTICRNASSAADVAAQTFLLHCIENDLIDDLAKRGSHRDGALITSGDTPEHVFDKPTGYHGERCRLAVLKYATIKDEVIQLAAERHEKWLQGYIASSNAA